MDIIDKGRKPEEIRFKVLDVEAGRIIPSELVAITGDGRVLTRDSEDGLWMDEVIDIRVFDI